MDKRFVQQPQSLSKLGIDLVGEVVVLLHQPRIDGGAVRTRTGNHVGCWGSSFLVFSYKAIKLWPFIVH